MQADHYWSMDHMLRKTIVKSELCTPKMYCIYTHPAGPEGEDFVRQLELFPGDQGLTGEQGVPGQRGSPGTSGRPGVPGESRVKCND